MRVSCKVNNSLEERLTKIFFLDKKEKNDINFEV